MQHEVRQHHTVDVAEASKLWGDGFSAAQIASRFSVSRGVIIGLAHRQRHLFPGRKKRTNPIREMKKKKESLVQELLGPEATDIEPTDYDSARKELAKGLVDIRDTECRFPLDNGRPFMFCAAAIREGSPYCSHHHFRAYDRREKK